MKKPTKLKVFSKAACIAAGSALLFSSVAVFGQVASSLPYATVAGIADIKRYGAIGDGSAHPLGDYYSSLGEAQAVYPFVKSLSQQIDFAAIQKALNLGGEVYAPAGTYILGGDLLNAPSNTTFYGAGPGTTLKRTSGLGGVIQNVSAGSVSSADTKIHFRDFTADLNGSFGIAVALSGVNIGSVTGVTTRNGTGYGIFIGRSDVGASVGTVSRDIIVSGNHALDVSDVGIEVWGSNNVTVTSNTVTGTAGIGVFVWEGATDVIVANNAIEATSGSAFVGVGISPPALFPSATQRVLVIGNTIRNATSAVKVIGSASLFTTDVTVTGNKVYGRNSNDFGLESFYAARVKGDGNTFSNVFAPLWITSVPNGLTSAAALYDSSFDNNKMIGGSTSEVYFLTRSSVSGNQFSGQDGIALKLFGVTDSKISGNQIGEIGNASSGLTIGIVLQKIGSTESLRNMVNHNIGADSRNTKYLRDVVALGDASDLNQLAGNFLAIGAPGGMAVRNSSTGAANVTGTTLTNVLSVPASSSAVGVAGSIAWDDNFIYIATAANTWKRIAIATWQK